MKKNMKREGESMSKAHSLKSSINNSLSSRQLFIIHMKPSWPRNGSECVCVHVRACVRARDTIEGN